VHMLRSMLRAPKNICRAKQLTCVEAAVPLEPAPRVLRMDPPLHILAAARALRVHLPLHILAATWPCRNQTQGWSQKPGKHMLQGSPAKVQPWCHAWHFATTCARGDATHRARLACRPSGAPQ
jgi:hypothetical protein